MSIDELLIKYRDENLTERDTGTKFERLMKNFLLTNPKCLSATKMFDIFNVTILFLREFNGGDSRSA